MYVGWTYDPLMAPNAWFNLGVLGARVACLVDNAYGELDDALNRGLPTHRFWVVWDVRADTVDVPGVDGDGRRLAIPSDVGAWRRDDMARARAFYQAWFETVQAWWADGWRIVGVERGPTGVSYRWIEQGPTKEPVDAD